MLIAFLMLTVAAEGLHVIATFNTTLANPDKMVAEQIEKPADILLENFAAQLVEAEGLASWSTQDPVGSRPGAILPFKARHAANGREVVVYFSYNARTVCKVSRARGGFSNVHQEAIRWCATSLGISLPAKHPPVAPTTPSVDANL
jgi:hypothetical protein